MPSGWARCSKGSAHMSTAWEGVSGWLEQRDAALERDIRHRRSNIQCWMQIFDVMSNMILYAQHTTLYVRHRISYVRHAISYVKKRSSLKMSIKMNEVNYRPIDRCINTLSSSIHFMKSTQTQNVPSPASQNAQARNKQINSPTTQTKTLYRHRQIEQGTRTVCKTMLHEQWTLVWLVTPNKLLKMWNIIFFFCM